LKNELKTLFIIIIDKYFFSNFKNKNLMSENKEFPKKYDHKIESEIYKKWQDKNYFNPETVSKIK
jgi:hypothetical protein